MLEVLWEDSDILVVRKPVGMEAQSSRGFSADMVSEIKRYIHKLSPEKGEPYVGVVHRLDKPVSGVMVYAKTKKAAGALSQQVAKGSMKKKYQAVLCGQPTRNVDNYVDNLLKDEKENYSRIVDKGITEGKEARLSFKVLASMDSELYGRLTLVEISLLTGRHHQIRVQMAGHKTPLWGDQKYNPAFARSGTWKKGENIALSAVELSFVHPGTNKLMCFSCSPEGQIFQQLAAAGNAGV